MTSETRESIERAFAVVPYPGDENLVGPDAGDQRDIIIQTFRGRDWRSLQPEELASCDLLSMTPQAIHYYLPAYFLLLDDACDEEKYDTQARNKIADDLWDAIAPPAEGDSQTQSEKALQRLRLFSADQREVVEDYLTDILKQFRLDQARVAKFYEDMPHVLPGLRKLWDEDEGEIARRLHYWQNLSPELRHSIQEAFADVPYPGDDNLALPGARDDGDSVIELFRGRDWRSLQPRELWPPAVYFMTPQALHYYLPGYLLGCDTVEAGDAKDSLLGLIRSNGIEYFDFLSTTQKKVLADYIYAIVFDDGEFPLYTWLRWLRK
jgi:hypothetical protein